MPILHVNVDHVATIREARKTTEPDPVFAALQAEQAGAAGITIHLREDRRHINDRDVRLARELIQTKLNLEMAATAEMVRIAIQTRPEIVTLVPEKREEVTTEGGLDCISQAVVMRESIKALKNEGIRVSLFIDPDLHQIDQAQKLGADDIELHTGEFANAQSDQQRELQLKRLETGAIHGHEAGLKINAGHGLTYFNIKPVAALPYLKELNIGHSIIARAVYVGLHQAIIDMLVLLNEPIP
ncbi:MAG: pyridoxine 5'-phosphate synthase [SAR324 cluster bacterium]|nr:pyridoxine 5'-phosphate synthase [SAR324 cluster bacterium]